MNSLEIMSTIREKLDLGSQEKISDRSLLVYVNMGYLLVAVAMKALLADVLVSRKSLSIAVPASVYVPGDCEEVINVERKYGTTGDYVFARKVEAANRAMIGTRNYPSNDETHPLYVRMGRIFQFSPVGTAEGDCRLEYRRRVPDLIWGKAAAATKAGTSITFDVDASKIDDVYNDHYLHTYVKNGDNWVLEQIQLITDYVGSTRVATLDGAITSETPPTENVWYSLEPLISTELHRLIVKAGIVEVLSDKSLQARGLVDGAAVPGAEADFNYQLASVLGVPVPQKEGTANE
ncbi:MAG: hypothetical protein WC957_00820 [Candidatus Neomarinimicrobiota bacterium]|jgi:hypothetical protein